MSLFSFFSQRKSSPPPARGGPPRERLPAPKEDLPSVNVPPEPPDEPGPREFAWEQTVRSVPDETVRVLQQIMAQLESLGWCEPDLFGIRLALEEALMNAIKHGNDWDAGKTVTVFCRLTPQVMHVEIEDEGPGFSLADVPDPTDAENLEKDSGRGIALMHHFMSAVSYNDAGNRVIMEKHRAAA